MSDVVQIRMRFLRRCSGDRSFTSEDIPRPAGTPMPADEVIARLRNVFEMSHSEYHFFPSPQDHEALRLAVEALLTSGGGGRPC